MPSFCEYRNCHNLASSTYMGYCNQYHYERAQILALKEKLKVKEESLLVSCVKKSEPKLEFSQKQDSVLK